MSSALAMLQSTDHAPTTGNEEHHSMSEISLTPRKSYGSSSSSGRQRPTLSRTSRRVIAINRFVRNNNISREQRMKDIVTEMERDRGRMMMISNKRSSSSTLQCHDDDDDDGVNVDNKVAEDTNDNTNETHGSDENTEHEKPDVTNAITGGGETTTLPTRPQKKVTWDIVQFRTYETVLGDNPSVSSGAPISLGWRYTNDSELEPSDDRDDSKLPRRSSRSGSAMPIDEYEAIRLPQRMPMEQLVVSQWDREQRLMDAGFSRADMNKVIASVTHIKVSRNQNAKLGFFEKGGFQTLIQKQRMNIGKKKGMLLI